jgi:hypothetical protein
MSIFSRIFNRQSDKTVDVLTTIHRTQIIDGFSIPAVIHNVQYHFTDLQVYSDGLVWCWEMVDLKLFKEKLSKRWVVTSIPDGEQISIFSLGYWKIINGKWDYNENSFYEYIYSLIKKLNPRLENLYDCHGKTTEKVGNANYSIFGFPKPKTYYLTTENRILQEKKLGESIYLFYRADDEKLYLAQLSVFEDGKIELTNIPEKQVFELSELKKLIDEKKLLSEIALKERVTILGFGSFEISDGKGVVIQNKYLEILDIFNKLQGIEGTLEICRKIFEEYKKQPSEELKNKLKIAYENIPQHQRIFVGDMDTKDHEVKRIIYGGN